MRLLLIGPPGSGKGTQGERLAEALDVQHIAAGDVLRAHVYGETKLGLQVAGLLKRGRAGARQADHRCADADALERGGGRADTSSTGSRGRVAQAQRLDRLGQRLDIAPRRVIHLDVDARRAAAPAARARGASRAADDDTPEVIARRLEVFRSTTAPVVDVYLDRGALIAVDGAQTPDEITQTILAALSHATGPLTAAAP